MSYNFIDFLSTSPHKNGVLSFVLGIVFVLTIYHFMLYFQHKNKTYIYYSSYTFLVFIAYFSFTEKDFLDGFTNNIKPFFKITHLAWVWIYNIMYFLFVFDFLNFKKHHKKETKFIQKILFFLIVLAILLFIYSLVNQENTLLKNAYTIIFLPIIISLTFYCFYLVFKTPEQTKYYILFGSFILFISSVLGTLAVDFNLVFENKETGYLCFYLGLIIENIFFSLGLGRKQKQVIYERDEANQKLITKLTENENLKDEINKQLLEKINVLKDQITLKEEIDNLKLTALRSQMNPHFIFNALNSIKHYIINNEPKNAAHYLTKFSKLIRKILEASDIKEIALNEELETTQLYVTIENIRFSNEINFKINIDKKINISTIKVPPLILQPFLENAIWHGLSSKKNNKKILISIIKFDKNHLQISIEDNGIGRKAAAIIKAEKTINRKSVGINLTKERLTNFVKNYTNKFSIVYKDLEDKNKKATGTKVIIKIPLT